MSYLTFFSNFILVQFPMTRHSSIGPSIWESIQTKRDLAKVHLESICKSQIDKISVLDHFAERLESGDYASIIAIGLIKEWDEELDGSEMFELFLNTFCQKSSFSSIKEQIDWIRCVSVIRSYFNTNRTEFITHSRSLKPPVYIVN